MNERQRSVARLMEGVRADVDDYHELRSMLSAQFGAALRHETLVLTDLAERIVALTGRLEERREERMALARFLMGSGLPAAMPLLLEALPRTAREALEAWWGVLEDLVNECKAQNMRNCRLMVEQHEIMQRVLDMEVDIYAPG
ncbi:flagellar export chaperone FlgN [Ramlibacter sp. H39-3-26]|uniref:flagellar export chaperone FlgN n=1 Tax=Curvibacter soli TaxID=3031331 RepID=UPI0023D9FDB6|nr:flagellar export chaperone FlgN [Ramlibacter sp. H39-3-26]MDF1484206.1 flagellar export chaperone FlgN [Ramlibacter sp. H39-3-26]